jgi:RNA polymerase subunit RPABC4/transcription elongation factor Spt4
MTNCPICNGKVDEKAKFCPECGVQLTKAPSERAWIVAMQERIKTARSNDNIFTVIAVSGILIAVVVPYYTHFIKLFNMDMVSWALTFAGLVLFIGSAFGIWWENNNVKDLIKQLEKGQEEYIKNQELEEAEEEESGEKSEEIK